MKEIVQYFSRVEDMNVTDGMFCMNRTTSVPKSALRYTFVDVDGVDLSSDLQG